MTHKTLEDFKSMPTITVEQINRFKEAIFSNYESLLKLSDHDTKAILDLCQESEDQDLSINIMTKEVERLNAQLLAATQVIDQAKDMAKTFSDWNDDRDGSDPEGLYLKLAEQVQLFSAHSDAELIDMELCK